MTHTLKQPEAQTSLRNRSRPKKPIGMYDYDITDIVVRQ